MVGSLARTTHSVPSITPTPVTRLAPDLVLGAVAPASGDSSRNGASRVEQQLDALAREQLAARVVALDVALAAAGARLVEQLLEARHLLEHGGAVRAVALGGRVEVRAQDGHVRPALYSLADRSASAAAHTPHVLLISAILASSTWLYSPVATWYFVPSVPVRSPTTALAG